MRKRAVPREAGAKGGGRPKKAAAADAVLSMPCCSSPLPSPVHKGRSSPDEARRRRSDDQITCEDAASAGLQKPLGERPHKEPEQLDPEGRKSQAGQKRKQLPEQGQIKQGKGKQRGSLCFLCLLLSDDKQNLAFINAVYLKKRKREGRRSSCSRGTKKARQQQQRQHLR